MATEPSVPAPPPEPWLRGPVADVPVQLQPVAHALIAALEDVEAAVSGLDAARLWSKPGDVASIGFHLAHLAGSTDRLMTYARAEALTEAQRDTLLRERRVEELRPSLETLLATWRGTVSAAIRALARTPIASLQERREVGRAKLPSTVQGLLFHAAEHAARHAGQIVTTSRLVR